MAVMTMTPTSANSVAVHVENMTKKKDFKSAVDSDTDHLVRGSSQMWSNDAKFSLLDFGIKKIALFPCVLFPLLLVAELTTGSCWHKQISTTCFPLEPSPAVPDILSMNKKMQLNSNNKIAS